MTQTKLETLGWDFGPLFPGGPAGYSWAGRAAGVQPVILWLRPAPRKPDPGEHWRASDWCLTCMPDYSHFLGEPMDDMEPIFLPLAEFLEQTAEQWAAEHVMGDEQGWAA